MNKRELARIGASGPRRVIGVGSMLGLGVVTLYLALSMPPVSPLWLGFLVVFGLGALAMGQWTWRTTAQELVLTEDGLFDSTGATLARLDEIERIDRGMFAVKPSNGFSLVLSTARGFAWRPGLWWRAGRRVAVGGMTPGHRTRPLADALTVKLMERGPR